MVIAARLLITACLSPYAHVSCQVKAGDVLLYRSDMWRQVVPLDGGDESARHALRVNYSQPHIAHRFHPFVGDDGGPSEYQHRFPFNLLILYPGSGCFGAPRCLMRTWMIGSRSLGDQGFRFNPKIVRLLNPRQRRMLGDHGHYGYDK